MADKSTQSLVKLNNRLAPTDTLLYAGTIADIDFAGNSMLLCDMGQLNPNNGSFGKARLNQANDALVVKSRCSF